MIFAPDTPPIAYLPEGWPVITWTDATFANLLDSYSGFSTQALAHDSVRDGMNLEQRVLARSATSIFASEWAARSAIDVFGADPRRVRIIPFGANLEAAPGTEEVRDAVSRRLPIAAHCSSSVWIGSEREAGRLSR